MKDLSSMFVYQSKNIGRIRNDFSRGCLLLGINRTNEFIFNLLKLGLFTEKLESSCKSISLQRLLSIEKFCEVTRMHIAECSNASSRKLLCPEQNH